MQAPTLIIIFVNRLPNLAKFAGTMEPELIRTILFIHP